MDIGSGNCLLHRVVYSILSLNMLKRIGKYLGYILLLLCSLIVIGLAIGLGFGYYVEYGNKCNDQFIAGCMAAGLSEQSCKNRLF